VVIRRAIILAGGARDAVCVNDPAAVNKTFVRIAGTPLVTRVLRALRETRSLQWLRVVAPHGAPDQPLQLADERVLAGTRIGDSLSAGLADLPPDELVLIAAGDLPIISPAAIDRFLNVAAATNIDLGYGYLERVVHESQYPTLSHTWARLADGVFCGTGLVVLRPRFLPRILTILEQLATARKAPWRLAAVLGLPMLLRYAGGILSIADIERRASRLLGAQARGIRTEDPELAINIDRFDDLVRVEQMLTPMPTLPSSGEKPGVG